MVIGNGNQRACEKEEWNGQINYRETRENMEWIATRTEVGVLADNMDAGTDKCQHVNEEHDCDKVVGEDNHNTFQFKEQYLKNDIEEDGILLLILQLMKHQVNVGKNVITFAS